MTNAFKRPAISILFFCLLIAISSGQLWAQTFTGRIAVSADGNHHDRDDIAATPMSLAMIAALGLQSKLIHYDYNNHLGIVDGYPHFPSQEQDMTNSTLGAGQRFGFNMTRFFNDQTQLTAALNNLTNEINLSSASNPLIIIGGGPMEVIWRAVDKSNTSSRKYVTVISHSIWNNDHADTPEMTHTADDVKALGVNWVQIMDQNTYLRTPRNSTPWLWLRDASDPNLRWVWDRFIVALTTPPEDPSTYYTYDCSDAGMVYYALTLDQQATPVKLKNMTLTKTMPAVPSNAFLEKNGLAVFEMESQSRIGDWALETTAAGYTGSGYFTWRGLDYFTQPGHDPISYPIKVENPGVYNVRLYAYYNSPTEADQQNDIWMQIDNGTAMKIFQKHPAMGSWSFENQWEEVPEEKYVYFSTYLLKGYHSITFSGRSHGFSVSRVHAYQNSVLNPLNPGLPASTRESTGSTPPPPPPPADNDGSLVVNPTDDAYLENGVLRNDTYLKVEPAIRVSYLKYTVSGLAGTPPETKLVLTCAGDPGNGTIRLYQGTHNNWTEATLSASNAPAKGAQLSDITTTYTVGAPYEFDLSGIITKDGTYSFILEMDNGGNDAWFGSDEAASPPQLVFVTDGSTTPPPDDSDTTPPAGTQTFAAADDAYLERGVLKNDDYLKVEPGIRISYLKYVVTELSGQVSGAKLRVKCAGDPGSGTIRVYRGSHDNWSETTLAASTAPDKTTLLSSKATAYADGTNYEFDVAGAVTGNGNGTYSFIVEMDSGGNDAWFGSAESSTPPQLLVTSESTSLPTAHVLKASDDAYLENGQLKNDAYLKVEPTKRIAYLKYNISGATAGVSGAKLRLKCAGDPGNGTIRVYRGSHNNWTEATLSTSTAPAKAALISSKSSGYSIGTAYEFDISGAVTADGTYSFIMEMDSGGNDAWFGSDESAAAPELIATY